MWSKIDEAAMDAILRGQGSVNILKMITNGLDSDPTVTAHQDNILHSFSLLRFLLHSSNPKSPRRSPNKKRSGEEVEADKEEEEEGSVYYCVYSPTMILEDGFSWRKYGQKPIKNCVYKRNYYRCVNTKDENCKAKKQVQQIEESPSIFKITYVEQHTCQSQTTISPMMIHFENQDEALIDLDHTLLVPIKTVDLVGDDDDDLGFMLNIEHFLTPEFSFLPDEDVMIFENDLDFNLF